MGANRLVLSHALAFGGHVSQMPTNGPFFFFLRGSNWVLPPFQPLILTRCEMCSQTHTAGTRAEACVVAICNRIPMPIPGYVRVKFSLLAGHEPLSVSMPPLGDLSPLVFPNLVDHLLIWFGVGPVIELWAAAITERKILIHSANRSVLSLISESLVSLMYPFRWERFVVFTFPPMWNF